MTRAPVWGRRSKRIAPTGWRVLDSKQVSVRFRRAPGMLPLPLPLTGGTIAELRAFLNVKSDRREQLRGSVILEADLVAIAVRKFMATRDGQEWSGSSVRCPRPRRRCAPASA